MTRSELVQKFSHGTLEINHAQTQEMISIILDEIIRAVDSGERVELRRFGSFFPRKRKAHMARNPKTVEAVSVADKRVLFFKAGKDLKDRLNGKKVERRWTDER
jgi:integration host factor subunit beta